MKRFHITLFNNILRNKTRTPTPIYYTIRHISERSFAAKYLREQGIKLDSASNEPEVIVDPELVDKPTPRVQKLANEIIQLKMMEYNMLFKLIQTIMGISDSELVKKVGGGNVNLDAASTSAAAPEAAPEAVKDTFDVKLNGFDAKAKIKIIKEVRGITGLGLKEAKELVEKAPVVVKDGLTKEDAEKLQKVLAEAGADIELV
mmetsp:Transcript_2942/g.4461  ORF Transcript_2942/g.4461 Transcript_2942/m.4461 type:complete len:203 (-) Transcript_2942:59-667(-)